MRVSRALACFAALGLITRLDAVHAQTTEKPEFSPIGSQENFKDDYIRNKYLANLEVYCQQTAKLCPDNIAGALIHKHWVLTRAFKHHELVLYFMVHLGLKDAFKFLSEHTTAEFYVHPRSQPLDVNSLMLVKLQRPAILIDDALEPILLPPRTDVGLQPRSFTLSVHALAENGSAITVENFYVVDTTSCIELLPLMGEEHYLGVFCAMPQSQRACKAVPGSLAVWGSSRQPVLLGIYSRHDCEKNNVALFTNVAMYISWIEKTVGSDLSVRKSV